MTLEFITENEAETEAVGAALGRSVETSGSLRFISLDGDMGAGKTAFVRGLASVLSPESRVKSPTYTIVNEYRRGRVPLFHFDLYRISDVEEELYGIGFEDYLAEGVCVAEWSSILGDAVPEGISVSIEKTGDTTRRLTVTLPDEMPPLCFSDN